MAQPCWQEAALFQLQAWEREGCERRICFSGNKPWCTELTQPQGTEILVNQPAYIASFSFLPDLICSSQKKPRLCQFLPLGQVLEPEPHIRELLPQEVHEEALGWTCPTCPVTVRYLGLTPLVTVTGLGGGWDRNCKGE